MKVVQKEKIFDLARIEKVHATQQVTDDEAETYLVGNPPYMGGKKLSVSQECDMEQIFGSDAQHKNLDYICGFFRKGASFLRQADALAFVATTSINQGTHVPTLWPGILADGIEIFFSYEPFHWSNNAAKNAGVTLASATGYEERELTASEDPQEPKEEPAPRRRKLGFREAPFLYNLEMLDALVELRAVSQGVADSGDDRLIGQTVSNWVLNYARAKRGLRDLHLRLLGLW